MIIFDLGGVLLQEAEINLHKAMTAAWDINYDTKQLPRIFNRTFEFVNLLYGKECKRSWILGDLKAEEIVPKIKDAIHKSEFDYFFKNVQEKNLIKFGSEIILMPQKLTDFTELFQEGFDFVKKCKNNDIRVAILSNWDPYSFNIIKAKFTELFSLFDEQDIFIPAHIGYIKPDFEIYEFILKAAKLDAANTFFVDDSLTNIEGARKLGINSILYNGNWQETEFQLKKHGLALR